MFLGKEEEARRLYLDWRKGRIGPEQTGEHVILQGFQALRQAHPVNALMDDLVRCSPAGDPASNPHPISQIIVCNVCVRVLNRA